MAHHGVAAHLGAPRCQGPCQRAPLAGGAGPARTPVQVEAAGMDQGQAKLVANATLQVALARGEGQGRLEVAIGQLGQAVAGSMHLQQLLKAGVVRR